MSGQEFDPVADRIREHLLASPADRVSRQEGMLRSISLGSLRSAVYSGRAWEVEDHEGLSALPLTSYPMIDRAISEHGLDACLTAPAAHIFRTSGSTGDPKRMYYSQGDVDLLALDFSVMARLVGVSEGDVGWNMGGARPNVSGAMLELASDMIGVKKLTTLLTRETDLMGAMRQASRAKSIEVMASAAVVFYFIGRSIGEPGFLQGTVAEKLRRDYHLPAPMASLAARLYLTRVNTSRLRDTLSGTRIALSYAEPLTPYLHDLRTHFPDTVFHDVLGSTENPVMAAQIDPHRKGLSLFVHAIIPEIADPAEVAAGLERGTAVRGVPWYEWTAGMRGEMLITRPGESLPLVRYPTGDMIEVLDPAAEVRIDIDGGAVATLPLIRLLGRSVETFDFEVPDEMGSFLGNKIYSHHIHEALQRPNNVRWWELYNIKGEPGRLCFLVIPDREVSDPERFRKDTLRHLLRECDDPHHTLQIGHELGRVEVLVTSTCAYSIIQREIDRRVREGRSLGQLKPKRIHTVSGEEEFRVAVRDKMEA
ncbi:MAG: hypothetical protein ISF22_03660 [Methanomassiliicoccus sp.]|nr:hypothetical protein [Methanomassiliicoccus sp.]